MAFNHTANGNFEKLEKNSTPPTILEVETEWKKGVTHKYTQKIHPILPKEGEKNILVTSALPYVNNEPHLGNIIGCVLSADCFSRYSRLRGQNTLFICGTDEYGTATETKALEEKLTPQEICDKYHKLHSDIYKWFNISFDYFGRTTTSEQTKIAQDIFLKLHQNQYLIEDSLEQLYCSNCQRFLADRFVTGTCPLCGYLDARGDQCDGCGKLINSIDLKDPKCKTCSTPPEIRSSNHLFLDLPKLEPLLKEFLKSSQNNGAWSQNSIGITNSWLKEGLKPRCITRDMKWGTPVPLPQFSDKVFYVWFDAPIGYISITANYTSEWKKWWMNPSSVRLVNFMAKDNVPFHTVVFPASLLGTGENYTMISDISATEYLSYESVKFSKSRSIGVFGNDAIRSGIKADIFRLYLLSNRPETQDTSFNWDDLITRNNSEFINNLGNFINRSLSLLHSKLNGVIPETNFTQTEMDTVLAINENLKNYNSNMDKYKIREAFSNILEISKTGNQYLQSTKPWEFGVTDSTQRERLETILSLSANLVSLLSLLLSPFSPSLSENLMSEINLQHDIRTIPDNFIRFLPPGTTLSKPSLVFSKIDTNLANTFRSKFGGKNASENSQTTPSEFEGKSKEDIEAELEILKNHIRDLKLKDTSKEKLAPEIKRLKLMKNHLTILSKK